VPQGDQRRAEVRVRNNDLDPGTEPGKAFRTRDFAFSTHQAPQLPAPGTYSIHKITVKSRQLTQNKGKERILFDTEMHLSEAKVRSADSSGLVPTVPETGARSEDVSDAHVVLSKAEIHD
jgi:hypothetical protein